MGKLIDKVAPRIESNPRVQGMNVVDHTFVESDKIKDTGLWVNPKIKEDLIHLKDNVDLGKIGTAIAIGTVDPTAATAKAIYDNKDVIIDGVKHGAEIVKDTFTKDHIVENAKTGLDIAKHALQYASLEAVLPGAAIVKGSIDNKDKIVDGVKIGAKVAGNVVKDATEKSALFKIGTKIGSIVKDGGDKIRDRLVEFKDTAVDKGAAIGASLRDFVKENDVMPSLALGAGAGISTAASFANAGLDAARAGVEAVDCDGPEI